MLCLPRSKGTRPLHQPIEPARRHQRAARSRSSIDDESELRAVRCESLAAPSALLVSIMTVIAAHVGCRQTTPARL